MLRSICLVFSLWLGLAGNVHAAPTSTLGAGLGFPHILHIDYSHWVENDVSVDFVLTPLFFLNIGMVGVTKHIPLSTASSSDHNVFVSGTVTGLVGFMDGSPAVGPGGRVGYEWLGKHVGIRLHGGGIVLRTSMGRTEPGPDLGVSLLYVRR